MGNVCVVGSINIDLTCYVPTLPKEGETIAARETVLALGGKGANQAVAAARLGATTTMIGAVGDDAFGADVAERLAAFGVTLDLHSPANIATGMAFIDVADTGANAIRISAGANGTLSAEDIRRRAEQIARADVVLLQNEIPLEASLEAARLARQAGARIIMDPAPAPDPFWPVETLSAFDILTPNAQEVARMVGSAPDTLEEALDAARDLSKRIGVGMLITLGAEGVVWAIDGQAGRCAAPHVRAIDTVAAGDCFNGAFAARLASGARIDAAIRFATHAASLATTRRGAADSIPDRAQVTAFMADP